MLCSYCQAPRVANEAPCLNCGAPSPLPKAPRGGIWGRATGPAAAGRNRFGPSGGKEPPNFQRSNFGTASRPQQLNSPYAGYGGNSEQWAPKPSFETYNPTFAQAQPAQPVEPVQMESAAQQQSLLPVPYQEMPPAGRQSTMSLQLIPEQAVEHLLPAKPAMPEVVRMAPMYTKSRPITPRYRAISGLLSVIIVALVLCGGSVYYAKASGKLAFLQQLYGGKTRPPSIQANQLPKVPDPPDKVDVGPAYNIIPSAATAVRIDPKTNFVVLPEKVFSPRQTFYLTFSVISPTNDGRVYTKWYTNNQYFATVQSKDLIKAGSNQSGSVSISYPQSAEGSVELYWNDQLAQKLYFVVR